MKHQDYYRHEDTSENLVAHFILETCQYEHTQKRAAIMYSLATDLGAFPEMKKEIRSLASDILDVEQSFHRYIMLIRSVCADEIHKNIAWDFFLDRLENAPLADKCMLIDADPWYETTSTAARSRGAELTEICSKVVDEVTLLEQRYAALLSKIRNNYFGISNREALAQMLAVEKNRQDGGRAA